MRRSVELSLAVSPLVQLVIGRDGCVRAASPRACELMGVPVGAHGMAFTAVVSADSAAAVLEFVERACATDEAVTFADQPWVPLTGESRRLGGGIVPLKDDDGVMVAAAVTIDPIDRSADGLAVHNDQLRRDNTELRSIADELRLRTDELNVVAIFLQSVLTSLRGAVVVIDTGRVVRVWNAEAERLWNIPRRVAMHSRLAELDLGFEQALLPPCIEAGLRGEVSADLAVMVHRQGGDAAAYTVSATPLLGAGTMVHGVTLLFVERRPA